jgi:hypothetical protein
VRLDALRRLEPPASPPGFLLRAALKYAVGVGIAAVVLTGGGVEQVPPHGHSLATNVQPTNVPCGTIATDLNDPTTATWTAVKSPYPGTASPYNLPVNATNNTDPTVQPCDAIVVPRDVTLKIDASQGPVQIFSHGAAINVHGGHLLVLGASEINSVLFDAEPDVASWTGITIDTDSSRPGNASLAYASIQHALNSITITSGATSTPDPTDMTKQLPFGLVLVNSGIGPSYFDGIDIVDTPVLFRGHTDPATGRADGKFGTVNNIGSQGIKLKWDTFAPPLPTNASALDIESVTFGSSVPFAATGCLPLQLPCSAGFIGNDAVVANFTDPSLVPNPPPVVINQSRFYRASSFGVELNNASRPVITNNNFDCNGTGSPKPTQTCVGTGLKYSAIYLNTTTVDLENSVTNNVGHEDGLDAVALNGTIAYAPGLTPPQQQLNWKNATNDPATDHPLGYLLNGDLNLNSGTFVVAAGSVVKSKGTINLTGAALDASDTSKPGTKVFTSLRDNVNIASCPSVFVQSCPSPLPAGEWGGISLVGSATDATMRSATKSTITNAAILYATTGVHILNGNSLTITGSVIGPTFADGVLAEATPLAVSSTTFGCPVGACSGPSSGNHGILADFRNSGPPSTGLKLGGTNAADGNTFQGSINEAIRAVGLAGQPVDIENNHIQNAGASGSAGSAGIYLQGADTLILKGNDVVGSGTGNLAYPAIWLDGVSHADFSGPISGNTGAGNGLNAIAFHGDSKTLTWQTVAASGPLGFMVDGNLLVAGNLMLNSGDYVPVLAGTIRVQNGALVSTGAVLTSLKEQVPQLSSCGSVYVPKASGVCPAVTAGDWGGLVLDAGYANQLTDSEIRYAVTGILVGTPTGGRGSQNLTMTRTNIRNTASDGVSTHSPLAINGGAFTNNGGRAININLTNVAPSLNQPVTITGHATVSGSGQEGILAIWLGGHTVQLQDVSVDRAGAYGINLYKADHLTLLNNTVTNSAATFPAIYLNAFTGAFANISGNRGALNGVDAIAFDGTVTDDLTWQTARKSSDAARLLGYILDNTLTMQPGHTLTVTAGDIVKVGNGGVLNLQGVNLRADDTGTSSQKVFTSLTDDTVGAVACHSAVVVACAAVAHPGDWGGIVLGGSGANATLVNAAVRYASTGILITSGASSTSGSSGFGLAVSGSSFGPSLNDGINATATPISVTTSSFNGGTHGISVDLTPAMSGTPLRLSGNRFMSTGAEAILGQALAGQPVWITDNRVQGAGTYGIRLVSADQLVLRNNNVASSGGGPGAGSARYPAIYLPAVSADFTGNVRGNVGSGNGLDALVFDGKVTGDLAWVTPSNTASTHALGYLFDGGVTFQGGTLSVGAGQVVKSLGGPITINGGKVTVTGATLTSLKDNAVGAASAVSCPSVLVSVCSPGPGDWGGLVITSSAAGLKGSGSISNGLINYANTGISIDSGPIPANPEPVPNNFRLTVTNTTISNASKDGINSLDTPFSVDSSPVQNTGANGIIGSFFSPANCSSTPPASACVRVSITNTQISGVGKDGIIANGLSGQPTVLSGNTVTDAGAYGIRLVGADQLTLTTNHVRKSSPSPASALRYPAIYLSSVKADFEVSGMGAVIQGNDGRGNGIDAVVFHGEATKNLVWKTAAPPPAVGDVTFGYLLDGPLTVDGDFVTNDGDIIKIMNGGIKISGGLKWAGMSTVGPTFTSLKDNPGLAACHSVFIPDVCPTLPNTTLATNSDWTGISIDGTNGANSAFNYGKLFYASSGITVNGATLTVKSSLMTGLGGYALITAGTGSAQIDCASIHGNAGGVSANGAATTAVTYSNLYGNTTATSKDFDAGVAATATYNWWGAAAPAPSQYNTTYVSVSNSLTQEKPVLKATSGAYVTSDNTNANGNLGKGKLTLTFNREMNTNVQPTVAFQGPDAVPHTVAGTWNDKLTWTTNAPVDGTTSSAGTNSLAVSLGTSCIPDGNNLMDPDTSKSFTLDFTKATVTGTGGATGITGTTATLNDMVNAMGWSKPSSNPKTATFAFFQLRVGGGSYDNNVANVLAGTDPTTLPGYASIGYGTAGTPVSYTPAASLTPNTNYDFRVVAFDLNGYTLGIDQHFKTDIVPNAPTAVTASPGNAKATVSWTAPAPNGGTAIKSYKVTASPGNATAITADGVTTSIDVTGLTNGTAYTFTVVATNAAGSGAASNASTAITAGTPPAPGSPNAAPGGGPGKVVLTWTVPDNNGSPIVSYTVTPFDVTTSTTGAAIVLPGAAVTGTTVTGLVSGHTYTFTVFATNGNGAGPAATTNAVVVP